MDILLTIAIGLVVCAALGYGSFQFGMWAGKMMWKSAERDALRSAGEGAAHG